MKATIFVFPRPRERETHSSLTVPIRAADARLPGSTFVTNGHGGARYQLALVMLQKLSHGAELVRKGEQGSSCIEFLNFVSKG
jgi:hypothetical protein